MINISIIASSVRPHLWDSFYSSLLSNECSFEVVFAGNSSFFDVEYALVNKPNIKYIHTGNIKPAQCYEIARRNSIGEYILWAADDCEFSDGLLDKVISHMNEYKTVLSLKTNEDGKNNDLNDHRFFSENVNTPLMAPIGVIYRQYLEELGGFDRRFVAGQWENDVVMRVLADKWTVAFGYGQVKKFESVLVTIDHQKKHGDSTKFWTGYNEDRRVLEDTWVIGGYKPLERPLRVFQPSEDCPMRLHFEITNREVSRKPLLPFEPYEETDLLTKSQSNKGAWD